MVILWVFSRFGKGLFLYDEGILVEPTVDSWGVSRGRSVAVAVACLHFNGFRVLAQTLMNAGCFKRYIIVCALPTKPPG